MRAAQETAVDITAAPSPAFHLSGTVIDANGAALPYSRVTLTASELFSDVGTTQADSTGSFRLSGIPVGTYLLASSPQRPVDRAATVAQMRVSVSSDIDGLVLQAQMPGLVVGRVLFDGESKVPFDAIQIRAIPVASEELSPSTQSPSGRVRGDGAFQLSAPPGLQLLRAFGMPSNWFVRSVSVDGREVIDTGVDVPRGGQLDNVVVTLTNRPAVVSGKVIDAAGEVIKNGCTVIVFAQERDHWKSPGRYLAVASVGADGLFAIRVTPGGEYFAIAVRHLNPTFDLTWDFLERATTLARRLHIDDGATTEIALEVRQIEN